MARFDSYKSAVRNLGMLSAVNWFVQKKLSSEVLKLTSKCSSHPLFARRGTSDLWVFNQIFVQREYRCLDNLTNPSLIVDLGANVGYSSAYFLSHFPKSYVIAVEPDPANFEILRRNLRPYSGRYKAVQAAVWPRKEGGGFRGQFNAARI
ncbi:FkbM family methyltransferase [Bradyrhizobium sp. HKCCYLRH3099]|uniref:FkbM family methyltransferase n=1 Tax=unclassified Bradyrhizobium TaxID=2631580 RepID=UPI003EBF12A4